MQGAEGRAGPAPEAPAAHPPKAAHELPGSLWTWRGEPGTGRAVVFDLDGVLSDAAERQHYLRGPRPDWEAFFAASADDPLVDEVAALLGLLAPCLKIVLLSARPARTRDQTLRWLARHELRWDLLVMRKQGDHQPARAFKQQAVRALRDHGLVIALCVEDDLRNVEMFREEGIPALYIHSGYYE
jgi:beta-phosphoglucomutase-like phosphatase (HAD superfamily)